jgi:hypothetical protein
MKKLSKLFVLSMLALLTAMPASAQYRRPYGMNRGSYGLPSPQVSKFSSPYTYYGLRVGLTGATVHSDDPRLDGGSMLAGLNLSVNVGVLLSSYTPLFFETGLEYIEKGGKGTNDGKKFTYSMNYIEVPLVLKYQAKIDRDMAVTPFLGGYLACGVDGRIRDFGEREVQSSFSAQNFKRFDGGLRLGCGLMADIFYAEVGYDVGLANVSNDLFDQSRTGTLFANIGIHF